MAKEEKKEKGAQLALLPHYYRIITENFIKKPIFPSVLLLALFVISFSLAPRGRFYEAKREIIRNPQNFSAHLVLLDELILAGEFEKAEKEISFLEENYFKLKEEERERFWQKNLAFWEENPTRQEKLIENWQKFLEKNPDYKMGWLTLAYYQQKATKEDEVKFSLQKAYELDPGLPLDYPSLFSSFSSSDF
ncbi:hypothetical protein KBI33_01275 [Candidatus Shapirobacteria bacterium]|nr:hypothetical protein [Candidatus Shapirobacteria bacterium]